MPRRLPTSEQLRTWRDFIETAEALRGVLAGRLQAETGLSPGDYAVLLTLSEATDRRLRPSDLAVVISWERSRLSHHLGRMERRGLIRREGYSGDSRGAFVILTDEGSAAFHAATVPHLTAVRELFVEALTPAQLDAVAGISAALRERIGR
ncbi:MarR family transcriptional regulator [Actinoplanes sp. NPDC023801]|uniref:MarR family winged helix-turn-helix transcriptional regulator n=1 Tax=Actinoplanes sp. NPDC023801 TaxID=3154595 RepID=UPI0033C4458A